MLNIDGNNFFDQEALLGRLSEGLDGQERRVTFVVGAPLTASYGERAGVADVTGVIKLIREEFGVTSTALRSFDLALQSAKNKYQAAFSFLQGHRGQDKANGVIRRAVWQANKGSSSDNAINAIKSMSEAQLADLDRDIESWVLRLRTH